MNLPWKSPSKPVQPAESLVSVGAHASPWAHQPIRIPAILLMLALLVLLDAVMVRLTPRLAPASPALAWEQKPLLGYFVLTQSLAAEIQRQGVLNQRQLGVIRQVATQEDAQLVSLELESLPVVLDPSLTLAQKRERIYSMGYNRRAQAIASASRQVLALLLPASSYERFTSWVEQRWRVERQLHGLESFIQSNSPSSGSQILIHNSPLSSPRSYKIFATRYDSGGKYAVALPDMCLKFSNAGNRLCADDGYQINQGYFVYLSYDGSTAAEVWEAGPWNVDDNYWSTSSDPQPRRMFADLPAGMPEAQAAYFDGYNGGVDQYGRVVTAPFGIDLGRQVSIDIGLEPGNNDWINITYAWTEGWGKGKKPKDSPPPQSGDVPTSAPAVSPLVTATPNSDGSLLHEVQPGQAPWNIAIAYGITLQELYRLNGLSEGAIIRPGDKLVIRPALPTPTVTLTPEPSKTVPPTPRPATRTPVPSSISAQQGTSALQVTSTPVGATPVASIPENTQRTDPILLLIIGGAVLGTGLLLFGTLLKRR